MDRTESRDARQMIAALANQRSRSQVAVPFWTRIGSSIIQYRIQSDHVAQQDRRFIFVVDMAAMPLHPETSKSRRFLIMGALFTVGCLVFLLSCPSHPSYEGRKLRDWLKDFPLMMDPAGNDLLPLTPQQQMAVESAGQAIRMMGERALPTLESELRAKDNRLDSGLFYIFNRCHRYLRYEYGYTPPNVRRCRAISAVAELDTDAGRFVPTLKRISEDRAESDIVRHQARQALQKLAESAPTASGK
jgi:hypothetical protein